MPIIWIKTAADKPMPLDPKPVSVYIESESLAGLKSWALYTGHVPHWATCPAAEKFAKKETQAGWSISCPGPRKKGVI